MATKTESVVEQCADVEPHKPHPWGWRKKCPGKNLAEGIDYYGLERLAALHHDALRQSVIERMGEACTPKWGGLSADAKKARIAAMREVINDLKGKR